jgi:hypothetical protein
MRSMKKKFFFLIHQFLVNWEDGEENLSFFY